MMGSKSSFETWGGLRPSKALASDVVQRFPIDPWYRLATNLGASATVGGPCRAAERPVR